MAKIILKSRYLRAVSRQHSEHLIQYIAKREGVQKIDDTWKHRNKNMVARILADQRYTGKEAYPMIIMPDQLSNANKT